MKARKCGHRKVHCSAEPGGVRLHCDGCTAVGALHTDITVAYLDFRSDIREAAERKEARHAHR